MRVVVDNTMLVAALLSEGVFTHERKEERTAPNV